MMLNDYHHRRKNNKRNVAVWRPCSQAGYAASHVEGGVAVTINALLLWTTEALQSDDRE
jgi:hypothetical protein